MTSSREKSCLGNCQQKNKKQDWLKCIHAIPANAATSQRDHIFTMPPKAKSTDICWKKANDLKLIQLIKQEGNGITLSRSKENILQIHKHWPIAIGRVLRHLSDQNWRNGKLKELSTARDNQPVLVSLNLFCIQFISNYTHSCCIFVGEAKNLSPAKKYLTTTPFVATSCLAPTTPSMKKSLKTLKKTLQACPLQSPANPSLPFLPKRMLLSPPLSSLQLTLTVSVWPQKNPPAKLLLLMPLCSIPSQGKWKAVIWFDITPPNHPQEYLHYTKVLPGGASAGIAFWIP